MSRRAHRAARHACLRHACLRHACLRHACYATIVSSHIVSARVPRAIPSVPRCRRPACLPARRAATPRPRGSSNLPSSATLRPCATLHPRLQCSAVGGPHAWRAISALSPVAYPLSPPPPPHAPQRATSQTLNYQGRRLAFATTRLPRSHRKLSQLPLPAPAPARLSLRLIVPFTHPYTNCAKVTTDDASTTACDVRRRRRRPRPDARAT